MAVSYKDMISDTLLELNQSKSLKKISVTDIQKASGVSRQTFYNHFKDIFDLIQYTYTKNIVIHWDPKDKGLDFCDHLLQDFSRTMKYRKFLKDAFDLHGPNNLMDYMVDYCIDFEQQWMQTFYGEEPVPDEMRRAVTFAAGGAMYIKIRWIRGGIDRPLFDVVQDVIDNENRCLTPLFFPVKEESPFHQAGEKIRKIILENKG